MWVKKFFSLRYKKKTKKTTQKRKRIIQQNAENTKIKWVICTYYI